jgi:hypothetical protein
VPIGVIRGPFEDASRGARIFGIFEDLRGIFGAFPGTFGNSWEIFGEPAGIFENWPEKE